MKTEIEINDLAEWDDITESAQMPGSSPAASVAWRIPGKGSSGTEITLNKMLMDEIGWRQGALVRVKLSKDRRALALVKGDVGKRIRVRANCGSIQQPLPWVQSEKRKAERVPHQIQGGALILTLPQWAWPGADQSQHPVSPPIAKRRDPAKDTPRIQPRPTTSAAIPAAPLQVLAPVAASKPAAPPVKAAVPLPAPVAAPALVRASDTAVPPPEDLAEAAAMIRAGKGAKDLQEYFGWDHPAALAFANTIRNQQLAEACA